MKINNGCPIMDEGEIEYYYILYKMSRWYLFITFEDFILINGDKA
jgi:hypothetical protein